MSAFLNPLSVYLLSACLVDSEKSTLSYAVPSEGGSHPGSFPCVCESGNLTFKDDQGKYNCNTELGSFPM